MLKLKYLARCLPVAACGYPYTMIVGKYYCYCPVSPIYSYSQPFSLSQEPCMEDPISLASYIKYNYLCMGKLPIRSNMLLWILFIGIPHTCMHKRTHTQSSSIASRGHIWFKCLSMLKLGSSSITHEGSLRNTQLLATSLRSTVTPQL